MGQEEPEMVTSLWNPCLTVFAPSVAEVLCPTGLGPPATCFDHGGTALVGSP